MSFSCFLERSLLPVSSRKIEGSLLTLRAASLLNQRIVSISEKKINRSSSSLRDVVSDFGLVLFNPLDEIILTYALIREADDDSLVDIGTSQSCEKAAFVPDTHSFFSSLNDMAQETSETSNVWAQESSASLVSTEPSSCGEKDFVFDHEAFPVQIEAPENPIELVEAPPILDVESLQEIVDRALPRNLRIYKWKRVFAIAKDGDLLFTMLQKCSAFKHTLMVLKTTKGHILGGFASEKWQDRDGYDNKRSYFGTGTCFLFSSHPADADPTHAFSFYKWSGINDYCQICDTDSGKIAMGGGEGDFGLVIEDGFFRGTSGHCATFNNAPLIPGIDGSFEIVDFEVYGLLPLVPTVSRVPSDHKFGHRSLVRTSGY